VLLLGGFFHCLYIAMTEKLPAGSDTPAEDGDGSAEEPGDASEDLKETEKDGE
jgi:hypothetical protein